MTHQYPANAGTSSLQAANFSKNPPSVPRTRHVTNSTTWIWLQLALGHGRGRLSPDSWLVSSLILTLENTFQVKIVVQLLFSRIREHFHHWNWPAGICPLSRPHLVLEEETSPPWHASVANYREVLSQRVETDKESCLVINWSQLDKWTNIQASPQSWNL